MKLIEEVMTLLPFGERGWVKSMQLIAQRMDQREVELERVRVHLGFGSDWSPVYDRMQKAPPAGPVKWFDKFCTLNGMGGVAPFLQELAAGCDVIEEKMAEALSMIAEPAEEKRRPGRPSNAEVAARRVGA